MCVTWPGRIEAVTDGMAVVRIQGQSRRASLAVVPDATIGDWVIVAAGTVLEIVEPEEAVEILAILDQATRATQEDDS